MDLASQQFLFIVGSPRSGTTMLQVLLGSHPQVATTVELTLFNYYAEPWMKSWELEKSVMEKHGFKRGLPIIWDDKENEAFLLEFLRRAYAKLVERFPGRTHVLDKNPTYSLHIPLIKRLLPGAKFIHIIRDGRDVAVSLRAAADMGFQLENFADGAARWKEHVLKAREASAYPSDYLELRYEDFLNQRTDLYRQVLEFCGLEADPAWIARTLEENTFEKMKDRRATGDPSMPTNRSHYNRGTAGHWRKDFSPRERYEFDRVAGDLLCTLGYAQPGWWAENAAELKSIPRQWETRRRRRVFGLALALARAALTASKLPAGFEYFDR